MIVVAVLAFNRVNLLKSCVENVLLRTSRSTTEIVIWNNASSDGTAAYLDTLTDPRIRVVHHEVNIGLNAFAELLPTTSAPYIVTVDEDVIDAPWGWDETLLDAFRRLPDVGFLATNQVDDPNSECARIMHDRDRHLYVQRDVEGVRLLEGPVGGWCAMTSREIHDAVGGFPQDARHVFFHHDDLYIKAISRLGLRAAILDDLAVFHASGPYYSQIFAEKDEFYAAAARRQRRKDVVKRAILTVPFAARLNARYCWFQPPVSRRAQLAR